MQKTLLVFLIFLALFAGVPRESCTCSKSVPKSTSAHSCCKVEPTHAFHSRAKMIGSTKSCCGMFGSFTGSLASSISILPDSNSFVIEQSLGKAEFLKLRDFDGKTAVSGNRAPPGYPGLAQSKPIFISAPS